MEDTYVRRSLHVERSRCWAIFTPLPDSSVSLRSLFPIKTLPMASPVTGDFNSTVSSSDHQLPVNDSKFPNTAKDRLISSQLAPKTSSSQPNAPYTPSLSKRKKSKPVRFEIARTDVQKEHSSPSAKSAVSNPSSPSSSLQKQKSPAKVCKTLAPSSSAMVRAVEVKSSLGVEFPSCIKTMVKSQVSCGFWMGLPLQFCKTHLRYNGTFVLEDEKGEQWKANYIAYKYGISAGWKKFALGHNLMEGDVLIFQVVEPTKLKIYIFKGNESNVADGALSLLNLEAHAKQITRVLPSPKTKRNTHPESLSLAAVQKKQKKSSTSSRSIPPAHHIEHSGNNSEEVGSELLEDSRPTKPNLFEQVKSFEDFHIMVEGVCIDSELPDDVRRGYYKLCFYNQQFLHDDLQKGLYYKLVAGAIGEIVSIADRMKNCTFFTTSEDFESWDMSLKSFEMLGMNVQFLRHQIRAITGFLSEVKDAVDMQAYVEAKYERNVVEDEIKKVKVKLLELQEKAKKLEAVSDNLKRKAETYARKFREEADVPW